MICALGLGTASVNAQNFQGVATYHSASSMEIRMGNGSGNIQLTDDMKKQLNKAMQKEYTLKFNVSESTWKEVESLEGAPTSASSGGMMVSFSSNEGSLLYKNTGEGRYEEEANIFGKPFLVKDVLTPFEWELTGETKMIGNYNCQKAVYTKIVDRRTFSMGHESDSDEPELETLKDTMTVTAWYTPDIPVTHGPDDYWGLPGLILEVNNGTRTLICSKVILNPEEKVELEKPAKGKALTRAEFDVLQEEKIKEMSKKFSSGKGNFVIKSGNNN